MSKTVEFAASIGDMVSLVDTGDIVARVTAMKVEICGLMYRVVWWQDGNRKEEWVDENEISAA